MIPKAATDAARFAVCLGALIAMAPRMCGDACAGGAPVFAVNEYTTNTQIFPTVRQVAGGGFVVAWNSAEQDGFGLGVFARVFDASAQPVGAEFQVNENTLGDQFAPSITPLGDGFALAWQSGPLFFCCTQDGQGFGVFARVFDASGAATTSEFQVNSYTTGDQANASAASSGDNFVIAWDSDGQEDDHVRAFVRAFSASGMPLGAEQRLATQARDDEFGPAIAAIGDAELLAVWSQAPPGEPADAIVARRLDAAGAPASSEFVVSSAVPGERLSPLIAASAPEGGASTVVAWSERGGTDDFDVFARAFEAAAAPVAAAGRINLHLPNRQTLTGLAAGADGFVVVWDTLRQDGDSYGVAARRLALDGRPLGPELAVNAFTTGEQSGGQAAMLDDGSFVIAWTSAEDGSEYGIVAARFDAADGLAACGDADAGGAITARDALLTLATATGMGSCAPRFCDADGDTTVSASDALIVLRAAVGLPVDLDC